MDATDLTQILSLLGGLGGLVAVMLALFRFKPANRNVDADTALKVAQATGARAENIKDGVDIGLATLELAKKQEVTIRELYERLDKVDRDRRNLHQQNEQQQQQMDAARYEQAALITQAEQNAALLDEVSARVDELQPAIEAVQASMDSGRVILYSKLDGVLECLSQVADHLAKAAAMIADEYVQAEVQAALGAVERAQDGIRDARGYAELAGMEVDGVLDAAEARASAIKPPRKSKSKSKGGSQ